MPDKRKAAMAVPSSKRARISFDDEGSEKSSVTPYEKPYSHPIYGQKNAFPGLDSVSEELCYDDAEDDGLGYLRMVRSEASALPSVFVAKTPRTDDTQPIGNSTAPDTKPSSPSFPHGFFDREHAYIAPPENKTTPSTPPSTYPEAQACYYNLLRHRFLLLRSTLKCSPPASVIAGLDDNHPITLPRGVEAARKEWRRLVMAVEPQMAQLACMDQTSVLGVLQVMARLISEILRGGDAEKIRRIGAWAWGLLGKCREIGELSTEEVGDIRDIGKRAAKILEKIREAEENPHMEGEEMPDSDSGEDIQPEVLVAEGISEEQTQSEPVKDADANMSDAIETELEAAKARLQAKVQGTAEDEPASADQGCVAKQTRALLDMIITVTGEFFGQRDLLDSREVWGSSV